MTYSLLWLPGVLTSAGLTVIEVPGWQNRGHGDEGSVLGVLCHHTCGPLHGDLPDLNVLVDGRPDLGGPLCNLGLGRSGHYYMIAAGKGWHAGRGYWQGVTDGNAHFIGIEAENTGDDRDTWPFVQMDAYKRGVAAILLYIGAKPIMCAGHKEYALPHGRKDDPNFDMDMFRKDVAMFMREEPSPRVVQPTPPAPVVPRPQVVAKPHPPLDPFEAAAQAVDPDRKDT
jgi:N-acetylmuramoyl-L-alanine amidase